MALRAERRKADALGARHAFGGHGLAAWALRPGGGKQGRKERQGAGRHGRRRRRCSWQSLQSRTP